MSAAFIIDCSMTMAWCFADEATPKTSQVLERLETESVLVPSLWFFEVGNVLAMAEKRKRIRAAKSDQFLSLLAALKIEVDDQAPGRAFAHLLPLCRSHGLTSYDAVYLDLATRCQLPLASLDDQLRRAAKAVGVKLLGK
jgi:predicted nucleic acid-binding protein